MYRIGDNNNSFLSVCMCVVYVVCVCARAHTCVSMREHVRVFTWRVEDDIPLIYSLSELGAGGQ